MQRARAIAENLDRTARITKLRLFHQPVARSRAVQTNAIKEKSWGRKIVAQMLGCAAKLLGDGQSERGAANDIQVPRSTLRYWQQRVEQMQAPSGYKEFFESPAGQQFLHALVVALHVVVGLVVGGGIRPVIQILELVQLTAFVGSAIGSHHAIASEIEQQVGEFGRSERSRLAESMAPKAITVCEDETFHPQPCLVAIEPVSNFIVAEQYVEQRDAKTWDETMDRALEQLPVSVVQSTSDEGKAILAHAQQMQAHHAPDLFHVQHEANRASALSLAHRVEHAEQAVSEAAAQLDKIEQQASQWANSAHGPGRPPNFDKRKAEAEAALEQTHVELQDAHDLQERNREAIRGLGRDYHPVDLATGEPRTAEQIADKLQGHFDTLKDVAAKASLPERSVARLSKAERQLPAMKATIDFFHDQVQQRVNDLALAPEESKALTDYLIPAAYLERAANRSAHAEDRQALRIVAHTRRSAGLHAFILLGTSDQQRCMLEAEAAAGADLFQRASSCVEGRNGQLSLRHHHLHHITPQRLEALTGVHNYFLQRPDGTTAAERFFGNKPNDLFQHLLNCTRPPPRPAAKRTRPATTLH